MTYTYALLSVDSEFYNSVKEQMISAGYTGAINDVGEIDMHGIALVCNNDLKTESVTEKMARHLDIALDALQSIREAYGYSLSDLENEIPITHYYAWEKVLDTIKLLEG